MAAGAAGPAGQPPYWLTWLPEDVASEAEQEPARFHALTQAFCAAAAACKEDPSTSYNSLMLYVPLLNKCVYESVRVGPISACTNTGHACGVVWCALLHNWQLPCRPAASLQAATLPHHSVPCMPPVQPL